MLPRQFILPALLGLVCAGALAIAMPAAPCAPDCDGTLRPVASTFRNPEVSCSQVAPRSG